MHYLIVGNSQDADLSGAAHADVTIQINDCRYADKLPLVRNQYIFLTNAGPYSGSIVDRLLTRRASIPFAQIILARNPLFYALKKRLLPRHRHRDYQLTWEWDRLHKSWAARAVSCFSTLRLERRLVKLGMPPSFMPSTGMIAYDWVSRQLRGGDVLEVRGFTFQGWDQHPWEIERQLVKSKSLC